MDDKHIIQQLLEKNALLEKELQATKDHLKKYTAPSCKKAYYEKNREKLIEKSKAYNKANNKANNKATPPEKRKEYNRISYLRRKEKQQMEQHPPTEDV